MTIGYQAVALVVPADAPAFPLGVTDLFRAVAGHSDQRPFPVVWRDVDPNLPGAADRLSGAANRFRGEPIV